MKRVPASSVVAAQPRTAIYLAVLAALSGAAHGADEDQTTCELATVTVTARYEFESGVHTPGAPGYIHPDNRLQPQWNAHANVQHGFQSAIGTITDKFYYYQLFGGGAVNISSNVAPPREYFFSVRRDF